MGRVLSDDDQQERANEIYFIVALTLQLITGCYILAMGLSVTIFGLRSTIPRPSTFATPEEPGPDSSKKDEKLLEPSLSITAIIPCLLDHEAPIIEETLEKALAVRQLASVVCVYNCKNGATPPADVVERLTLLQKRQPKLKLMHQPESRSKAANMNAALPTVTTDLIMILDADHHIDEPFAAQLLDSMTSASPNCCCMQGSVLIRGDRWDEQCLGALCWYFFNVVLPCFEVLSATTMFIGAGAVWRTSILQQFQFDSSMIAEDDDLSMRVIRAGYNIRCCPPAELTELACDGICAFSAQRFRWTYGYEQSLNRHLCGLICERPRALFQRLYSWCGYLSVYGLVVNVVLASVLHPQITIWTGFGISAFACGIPFIFVIIGVYLMFEANEFRNWKRILPWILVAILYAVFQAVITIYARIRMVCGITWKVTDRKLDSPASSSSTSTSAATEGSKLLPD